MGSDKKLSDLFLYFNFQDHSAACFVHSKDTCNSRSMFNVSSNSPYWIACWR